jgi:hypothetical protein
LQFGCTFGTAALAISVAKLKNDLPPRQVSLVTTRLAQQRGPGS